MSGIIGGAGSKSGVIGQTELDYEEGTWTPVVKAGGTAMSTSTGNTSPTGRYIKKGRIVNLYMSLWGLPLGSSSGTITIAGLPFTQTTTDGTSLGCSYFTGQQEYYAGAYNPQPIYRIDPGATTIAVYDVGGGGTWMDPYDIHDLTNYLFYKGFATYFTD